MTPGSDEPKGRILVVDDNADVAESFVLLLEEAGHDVRSAADGSQAIEAVRAFKPHLVLLDITLPRMSGYDVARRLHEEHGASAPILIALSGYAQEKDQRRSLETGFREYLVKPVDPAVLKDKVRAFLRAM